MLQPRQSSPSNDYWQLTELACTILFAGILIVTERHRSSLASLFWGLLVDELAERSCPVNNRGSQRLVLAASGSKVFVGSCDCSSCHIFCSRGVFKYEKKCTKRVHFRSCMYTYVGGTRVRSSLYVLHSLCAQGALRASSRSACPGQ